MAEEKEEKKKKVVPLKSWDTSSNINALREELCVSLVSGHGEDSVGIMKPNFPFTTGSLGLDLITGVPGVTPGIVMELYGPEAGGKTMLSYSIIAQAIKRFKAPCALFDMEGSFNNTWASTLGIPLELNPGGKSYKWLDLLYPTKTGTGDEAFDMLTEAVMKGVYPVIVVDSVDALTPWQELEGKVEDLTQRPGLKSKMMAVGFRKLMPAVKMGRTLVIFINQIRDAIGVMWGDPETTPGGHALKFYASLRIRVNRTGKQFFDPVSGQPIGHNINCKVKKTRFGAPYREADFNLLYYKGLDKTGEMFKMGQHYELIQKYNNAYWIGNINIGGKDDVRSNLEGDALEAYLLEKAIVDKVLPILHPRETSFQK